jgi:electron transfer flavoprotein beta subunit
MLEGTNEMRFGDLDDLFRAARYDLKVWNREAAGIDDAEMIGLKGSPTVVSKVFAPRPRSQRAEMIETVDNDPKNVAVTLLAKVFTQHPKLEKEIAKRAG